MVEDNSLKAANVSMINLVRKSLVRIKLDASSRRDKATSTSRSEGLDPSLSYQIARKC